MGDAGGDFAGGDFHEEVAGGDALAERDGEFVDRAHDFGGELRALEGADRAGDFGGGGEIFGAHGGGADLGGRERGGGVGGRGGGGVLVTTGEEGEGDGGREGGDERKGGAANGLHGERRLKVGGAA